MIPWLLQYAAASQRHITATGASLSLAYVPKDTIIFKQGNSGSYFYIIKEGSVNLVINDKQVKTLSIGESFGELALLHVAPRSGTVIYGC